MFFFFFLFYTFLLSFFYTFLFIQLPKTQKKFLWRKSDWRIRWSRLSMFSFFTALYLLLEKKIVYLHGSDQTAQLCKFLESSLFAHALYLFFSRHCYMKYDINKTGQCPSKSYAETIQAMTLNLYSWIFIRQHWLSHSHQAAFSLSSLRFNLMQL